jgi:hypothetical protein
MITIAIIAVIVAIAIPNLIAARKSANEGAAIGALKTVMSTETVFREGDKELDGNLDFGMLTELSNTSLVDSILGAGTKSGFHFSCSYSFFTSEFLWFAVANPVVGVHTGDRYFETNASGVIFYTTAGDLSVDTSSCDLAGIQGLTTLGK